jgi:uncharacterized membrane protein
VSANVINQETSNPTSEPQSSMLNKILGFTPSMLFILGAILLLVSIAFPYWRMILLAPQYPGGLEMRVFVNYMTGDGDPQLDEVKEIDGLNHYIGMESLYEAAKLERSLALPGVISMAVALVIAAFWRRRWTWILTIPAALFPAIFLGDLAFWMNHHGQNLDPYAPLSSAIKPFTPPIIGEGVIGQFRTIATVEIGWFMTVGVAVLILIGLLIRLSATMKQRSRKR